VLARVLALLLASCCYVACIFHAILLIASPAKTAIEGVLYEANEPTHNLVIFHRSINHALLAIRTDEGRRTEETHNAQAASAGVKSDNEGMGDGVAAEYADDERTGVRALPHPGPYRY
jgi:hypothetical protein